ncbi:hypothetical protein WOLCODRAFT_165634 [Wolfiporia cocos MD-104 SS10]|uniref:F-box domain-containing protein n=1 Tax=Wolfiporia cocos (strain MD-104) TaxID=742152 RepID=A0A2H3JSN4_WOLCO|nr:hypothetical protein WOLCODRAFT_165634 [Wolfiporia cocos MD-104 SS10]
MISTNFLALNYDVLALVLALLSPHDAAQLALVSQHAYAIAMPRVYSEASLGGAFHKPPGAAARQLNAFCTAMLADARRPVYLARLTLMRDAFRQAGSAWIIDASSVALLSQVLAQAKHLHTITVWGLAALIDAYPPILNVLSKCAHLRTVCLGGAVPSLSVLSSAFPHVRHLQLVDGGGAHGPDWDHAPPSGRWRNLDHVDSGRALLPLACSVRRVTLRDPLRADPVLLENTLEYIRNTRPAVLSCTVDASITDDEFVARLAGAASSVKHLELVLHGCSSLARVMAWMARVGPMLAELPLVGLALYSSTHAEHPTPQATPAPSRPSSPSPFSDDISSPRSGSAVQRAPRALVRAASALITTPTPSTTPPELPALAETLLNSLPAVPYLALQPYGPHGDAGKRGTYEPIWFARGYSRAGCRPVPLSVEEGVCVGRRLQGLDMYD